MQLVRHSSRKNVHAEVRYPWPESHIISYHIVSYHTDAHPVSRTTSILHHHNNG